MSGWDGTGLDWTGLDPGTDWLLEHRLAVLKIPLTLKCLHQRRWWRWRQISGMVKMTPWKNLHVELCWSTVKFSHGPKMFKLRHLQNHLWCKKYLSCYHLSKRSNLMLAPEWAARWTDGILAQLGEAFPHHTIALIHPSVYDRVGNNFKKIYSPNYSPSPTEFSRPRPTPPPYLKLAHLIWTKSTSETQKQTNANLRIWNYLQNLTLAQRLI